MAPVGLVAADIGPVVHQGPVEGQDGLHLFPVLLQGEGAGEDAPVLQPDGQRGLWILLALLNLAGGASSSLAILLSCLMTVGFGFLYAVSKRKFMILFKAGLSCAWGGIYVLVYLLLTHGFLVDEKGAKMSKSQGNALDPLDVISKMGADVLRLWVSSADYRSDLAINNNILKQVSETYRKIRNTARFLLSNLNDFDPAADALPYAELREVDRWFLHRLQLLIEKTRAAYDAYEFHSVHHAIHRFCVVEMSNFYLDITKDTLYAELPQDKKDDLARRYGSLTLDVESLRFIDRMVADSRDVALNHTAGLSTPQQIMMSLFAAKCLLDTSDTYKQKMQAMIHNAGTPYGKTPASPSFPTSSAWAITAKST